MEIKLFYNYNPLKLDSLFYDGEVLTANNGTETLEVFSCGHRTAFLPDNYEEFLNDHKSYPESQLIKYKNYNLYSEIIWRKYTDTIIQELFEQGLILENNWFEYSITDNETNKTEYFSDTIHTYDDCIDILNLFIKNQLKTEEYV